MSGSNKRNIISSILESDGNARKRRLLESLCRIDEADIKYQPYKRIKSLPYNRIKNGEGVRVFRVFHSDQLDSISTYGYAREFAGSKGGDLHDKAVYGTPTFESTVRNLKRCYRDMQWYRNSDYGDSIMESYLVGGFSRFFIFDIPLAKKVYKNNWRIDDQIRLLYGNSGDRVLLDLGSACHNDFEGIMSVGTHGNYNSQIMGIISRDHRDVMRRNQIRGLIYLGERDGLCSIVFDHSSVIPCRFFFPKDTNNITTDLNSFDIKEILTPQLYDRIQNCIDVQFEFVFGGRYDEALYSVNGFAPVRKGRKWNLVNVKTGQEISPVWFDRITGFSDKGVAYAKYNDWHLSLTPEGVINETTGDIDFTYEEIPQAYNAYLEYWKTKEASENQDGNADPSDGNVSNAAAQNPGDGEDADAGFDDIDMDMGDYGDLFDTL